MSTKENTFEIGELVKLKVNTYTDQVGIVIELDRQPWPPYCHAVKVRWQPTRWNICKGSQWRWNICKGSQWHRSEELEPAY